MVAKIMILITSRLTKFYNTFIFVHISCVQYKRVLAILCRKGTKLFWIEDSDAEDEAR